MKKIFIILITNILLILLVWISCDFIIYKTFSKARQKIENQFHKYEIPPFTYRTKPYFAIDLNECFTQEGKVVLGGRKPDGLEYIENKSVITIFGCSYALGQFLDTNETLSYRLSQALKCPVYNRALAGKGLQHMYQQSTLKSFYKTVPPSDTVIYVMMNDHYRRMLLDHVDILDDYIVVNYKKNGTELEKENYNNKLEMLFKSSYLVKLLKSKYIENYLENENNEEAIIDEALCYFVETKKNLQNRWKKDFNFVVLFYGNIDYEKHLKEKLIENGFTVLNTRKDIGIKNVNIEEYTLPDGHPNAKIWQKITPILIEKLELK